MFVRREPPPSPLRTTAEFRFRLCALQVYVYLEMQRYEREFRKHSSPQRAHGPIMATCFRLMYFLWCPWWRSLRMQNYRARATRWNGGGQKGHRAPLPWSSQLLSLHLARSFGRKEWEELPTHRNFGLSQGQYGRARRCPSLRSFPSPVRDFSSFPLVPPSFSENQSATMRTALSRHTVEAPRVPRGMWGKRRE